MPRPGSREHAVVLHFNLSRVVPNLIPDWLRTFSALASQENSWTAVALSKLAMHTRNALGVASRDTPEVIAALTEWVRVLTLRK